MTYFPLLSFLQIIHSHTHMYEQFNISKYPNSFLGDIVFVFQVRFNHTKVINCYFFMSERHRRRKWKNSFNVEETDRTSRSR